jgi:hypothetical protein
MAKRRTNQEWQTMFEKYKSSHLSQRVFDERNGLSLSYPPHDPTGRFSFNVRSSREAVS